MDLLTDAPGVLQLRVEVRLVENTICKLRELQSSVFSRKLHVERLGAVFDHLLKH